MTPRPCALVTLVLGFGKSDIDKLSNVWRMQSHWVCPPSQPKTYPFDASPHRHGFCRGLHYLCFVAYFGQLIASHACINFPIANTKSSARPMILESSFAIQHACKEVANLAAYNLLKDKAVYNGEPTHEIHASNRAVMLTSSNPLFSSCH